MLYYHNNDFEKCLFVSVCFVEQLIYKYMCVRMYNTKTVRVKCTSVLDMLWRVLGFKAEEVSSTEYNEFDA